MTFSRFFLLLLIIVMCGGAVFFIVSKSSHSYTVKTTNDFCPNLDRIVYAADTDFNTIKGEKIELDSLDTVYSCKAHIPNSTRNVLYCSQDEVPMFITTLYQGTDSIEAYRQFLICNQKFMECMPQFVMANKDNYENIDSSIYNVFTYQDKIVYIKFDKSTEDNSNTFSSGITITIDPDNPFYDKIRNR